MAFISNPTAAQFRRQGTVFINDSFSGKASAPGHGELVAKAAADQGFNGPIVGQQANESVQHDKTLFEGQMGKDEFQKSFEQDIVDIRLKSLRNSTRALTDLESNGANHSVLNLSRGGSKASAVQDYYERMRRGWAPEDPSTSMDGYANAEYKNLQGKKLMHNFATAYGLDEAKLTSKDAAVSGPERLKLQKLLIEKVNNAVDGSAEVKTAQKSYDDAVHSFESHNNSVIVAAENDGELIGKMGRDRGLKAGDKLGFGVSKDFFNNPLANSETTVVGAVNDAGTAKASYSSASKLAEIYTRGSVAMDRFGTMDEGTSFAAPRVAAAMARLHQMNPNLSSDDVEKMVLQMTREVKGMKVLDTQQLAGVYGK